MTALTILVDNMPVDDEPASVQAEISAALPRVTG